MLLDVGSAPNLTTGLMNYFNYFTEIETRFQQRRGSILMLSTLDWVLIESWKQAGVPLEAVLRGIDNAFDNYDEQRARLGNRRQRQVNGLAWCAQAVLEATEQFREASVGTAPAAALRIALPRVRLRSRRASPATSRATPLCYTAAAGNLASPANAAATESAARLRALSADLLSSRSVAKGSAASADPAPSLEDLDRTLSVLEEKLVAALLTATPEAQLVALREQAARSLAPYRGRMQAVQIKQVQQQFLEKRLLEAHALPRLSLFYMPHDDEA